MLSGRSNWSLIGSFNVVTGAGCRCSALTARLANVLQPALFAARETSTASVAISALLALHMAGTSAGRPNGNGRIDRHSHASLC